VRSHGFLAALGNRGWLPYMATVGLHGNSALFIMRCIGLMDIAIAVATLLAPTANAGVSTWAFVWAFSTALIRPLSGEVIWAFVERAGNWATPLALTWVQVARTGTHPIVSQVLALVPPSVPLPLAASSAFHAHLLAAVLVFVAGAVVAVTMRVVGGGSKL